MNKKFFAILLFFTFIVFICSTCYASTDFGGEMQDSANKTMNSMQNAGNGLMSFANDVGNGVKNMSEDIGNGIRDTADNIGRGVEDFFDGDNPNTTVNSTYNAIRTSTDATSSNMANTAWVWLILGITGIIIVALTWYYVSQDTGNNTRR